MRHPRRKLTDRFIKSCPAAKNGDRDEYPDSLAPGMELRVTDRGSKSFILIARYPANPKNPTRRALGGYGELTLDEARQKAGDWLKLIERGQDPRDTEARQKAQEARQRAETFGAVAAQYKTAHLAKLRSGDALWSAIEADLMPEWKDLPIRQIGRGIVMALLDKIETGRGLYARNRRLALIRHLFNFALDRELVDANPAARIKLLDEADRERVLSDAELVEIWTGAGLLPSPLGDLVKMLILSGQRRNEVAWAEWSEINEGEALWTIPGSRMKAKLVHEVPLVPAMLEMLKGLPAIGERKTYVFASTRRKDAPVSGFGILKDELDRHILEARQNTDPKAKPMADWRLHDLRRTMRSGLSRLKIPSHIAERVLAHIPGGIQGVYDRFEYRDEKRHALEAWAAYVGRLVDPSPANVADLDKARQKRNRKEAAR